MDIKYTKLVKVFLILTFVGIFTGSLSSCKIVVDNDDSTLDTSIGNKGEDSSGNGSVDETDMPGMRIPEPYQEPAPSELTYIKINGELIGISINPVNDMYRGVRNKSTSSIEQPSIESIEVGLDNGSIANQYKNYIGVTLRSLTGNKTLTLNYDTYRMEDMNGIGIAEENINVNFEDYKAGYYSSAYNNGLTGIGDAFQISTKRFIINMPALISFLKNSSQDHFHHETNAHETNVDGTMDMSNYDISEQFFAENAFRLEISVGGQIFYRGETFHSLNSCIFTASDTKPSDIDDICKAYLAMY